MLLNKVEYIDKISDNFCDRNVQFSMFSHGFSHGFPAQNDVFEDRISGKPVDLRQLWARDRCHSEKKISPHRKNYENHPNSNFKESSPSKSLKKKPLQNYTPENMEKQRPPSPQKKQKKKRQKCHVSQTSSSHHSNCYHHHGHQPSRPAHCSFGQAGCATTSSGVVRGCAVHASRVPKMGVRCTPKSSILIGFSLINHPFWDTLNLGNLHVTILHHKNWRYSSMNMVIY